ncbi:response regulator transcription factor [Domibacillus robiginosus]|uniref:response regulator transcription factor n=1 Tax=Domibacillus robiginosus TaxID=1071054 RepID=UPI00067BCCE2|nr:response regulator [Domibacillus robiginosus]
MYKVLLADDERIILEGISNVIDWQSIDTELVATARNGVEAYEKIAEYRPHIVISDIKMPGMDGLELAGKVQTDFPDIQFIILSGFSEFEYARCAMQHGVKNYLLKPCNEADIIETVTGAVKNIKQREQQRQQLSDVQSKQVMEEKRQPCKAYSPVINEVVDIIYTHFGDKHLSLKWVAGQMLYMNADYLGKLFKQETNERFSVYLTKVRIEEAMKQIGQMDDVRVADLAERTGFGDNPQYFSQVFKKYTGVTPTEYRKAI